MCSSDLLAETARELAGRVASGVVIHAGSEGCVLATSESVNIVPTSSVDVRDTNGAGDTHNGAFLAWLLQGDSPVDAARKANFAASQAVTRLVPAQCPRREDIVAWWNEANA